MTKTTKALILAAGEGTRLRPFTTELPKPMLPVVGVPLLAHTIEGLRRQGIVDLAINLHHRPETITDHFGDGRRFGVRIHYSRERELLGTSGAAKRLESFLDETFVVVYGDVLTNLRYGELLKFHRSSSAALTLALYRVENPTECGLVELDAVGRVTRFTEKPSAGDVFSDLANAGVLVCEPALLDRIPAGCAHDFGRDLLPGLIEEGGAVYGRSLLPGEYLIDIGTPRNYLRAQVEWAALQDGRRPLRPRCDDRPIASSVTDRAAALTDDYLVRLERTVREMPRDAVADVVGVLMDAWRDGRKTLIMGNGGSAATAAHTVNDLCKLTLTDGWPRFRAVSLADNVPLLTAWGNDTAYDRVFSETLLSLLDPDDVVLGISTSGNSPNVLRALEAARAGGARTLGFTGRDGGVLKELVDFCVHVPSDHIGRQEDGHQVLDHVIANTMKRLADEIEADRHALDPAPRARTNELVDDYLTRLERTVREMPRKAIAEVVTLLMRVWREGCKVFVMGNGGSAATAAHTVNDLSKLTLTDGWPRFRAISLSDNVPLLTAWGNDTDYDRVFSEPLLNLLDPGDAVLGISTSGNSPNVLRALEAARAGGAWTLGFTGRSGGALRELVDCCVHIPSDHIGRQEDGHLFCDHVVADTMRLLAAELGFPASSAA